MHQVEDEEQTIGLDRGEVLAVTDCDLRNPDLADSGERLMEKRVRLLPTLLWLEEVGLVEKLRINLFKIDKVSDIDGVRRLDLYLLKIFVAQDHVVATLVFESFYDLISRHFLHVGV